MRIRPVATASVTLMALSVVSLPAAAEAATSADRPVVVAHRGASAYAPENTVAAVNAAAALGIEWVENDVQRTKDGELIVMHDTTLSRTTNVEDVFPTRSPWKVSDFTLAEIQKLDAGSWYDPKFAGEKVPTLQEFTDAVTANQQSLLLELKAPELYPGIERQTLSTLRDEGWLDRNHVLYKLVVQSFNATSVKTVHDLKSSVKTGYLGTPAVADLPKYAQFADQINPRYTTISKSYISAIHAVQGPHGRPLEAYTWTVNDGPTAVNVAEMGVDGIISNNPDVVRDALTGAGYEVSDAS